MTARPVAKMEPPEDDPFLSTDDLAGMLYVTPQTLRQWRWQGQGPHGVKIGRRVLYRTSEVRRWLDERERAQEPTRPV